MNHCFSLMRKASPASSLGRFVSAALLTAALIVLGGCGDKGAKNRVSGKVTLKGDPVMGQIVFRGTDGKEAIGPITDGSYTVDNPPLGDNQILIKGITAPGAMAAPANPTPEAQKLTADVKGPKAKMGVPPPFKYANPNNGLTFKVTGGKQTKDFELTP